jgi:hypothetical protein
MAMKPADTVKEEEDEMEDARKPGEEAHGAVEKREEKTGEELARGGAAKKRARGGPLPMGKKKDEHGRHRRRAGGKVPGEKSKDRPDQRKRGGGLSDMNPTTAAGNVSAPSFEAKSAYENGRGSMGGDSKGKNG